MASEPVPPLLGTPTFEPGWLEITAPALDPLPPLVGGVRFTPGSSDVPWPAPLRPRPEPDVPEPPPTEGGGGTILLASRVPRGVPAPPPLLPVPPPGPESDGGGGTTLGVPNRGAEEEERVPVPPDIPVEGGGATTFDPSTAPIPARVPRELPPVVPAETLGGGGTTLAASEPVPPLEPCALTDGGGGGTTSEAPKIFPTRVLMNEPLPVCVGGGGTTVFEESGIPLPTRCTSCERSAEGGGAITAGAGKFSFELRAPARSGAETGGGTTVVFICTGERESSWLTALGAGGITLAAKDGLERT